ncbi:hypothetical protein MNV49_000672 [Pseudohyphozyma bogoriensis]|nr:hypothetical protein MNV49_000672 [Pseudohyphozyma bogoriensis]
MYQNSSHSAPYSRPVLPAGYCSICRVPFLPVGSISHLHRVEQRGLSRADIENLTWMYAIMSNFQRPLEKPLLVTEEFGGINVRFSRGIVKIASQAIDDTPHGEFLAHPACASLLLAELDLLPFDETPGANSVNERKLYDISWRFDVDPQGLVLGIADRHKPHGDAHDPTILCAKLSDAARKSMRKVGWDELNSNKARYKFLRPDVFTPVPPTVVSSRYAVPSITKPARSPIGPTSLLLLLTDDALKLVLHYLVSPENVPRATPASEAKLKDAVKTFLALPFLSRTTRHFFLTSTEFQDACRYLVIAKPKDASGHFAFLDSARFISGLTRHVDRVSASPGPPTSSKASGDWHYYLAKTLTSPTPNDLNRARIYKARSSKPVLPAGNCSVCRAPFLPVTEQGVLGRLLGSSSLLQKLQQSGLSKVDIEHLTWSYTIQSHLQRPLEKSLLVTEELGGINVRLSRGTIKIGSQAIDDTPHGDFCAHPACASLLLGELDLLPFDETPGADSVNERKLYDFAWRIEVDPQGLVLGIMDLRRSAGGADAPALLCVKMSDAARRDMQRIGWEELQSDESSFKFSRPDVFTPVPPTVVSSRYGGYAPPSTASSASASSSVPILNLPDRALGLVLRHLVAPENIARATPASEAKLKDAVKTLLALPFLSRSARNFFLTSTTYQNFCRHLTIAEPKDVSGHYAFLNTARFVPGLSSHVDRVSASPAPPTSSQATGDWHAYLTKALTCPTNLRRFSRLLQSPKAQYEIPHSSSQSMKQIQAMDAPGPNTRQALPSQRTAMIACSGMNAAQFTQTLATNREHSSRFQSAQRKLFETEIEADYRTSRW